MKKEKSVSPVKEAKKTIKQQLAKALATIKTQLRKQGITIDIDTQKEAKKLAKKMLKHAKTASEEKTETIKETPAPVKAAEDVKVVVAAKPKVRAVKAPKAIAPVVTPEPATPKPVAVKTRKQKV